MKDGLGNLFRVGLSEEDRIRLQEPSSMLGTIWGSPIVDSQPGGGEYPV